MKRIIKSIISPIIIAILISFTLGLTFYKTYKDNLDNNLKSIRLYLIQNGEYDDIDNMRTSNYNNNYVYYKIGNKYKTVIGITNNYDNIAKIKSLYQDNLEVSEYYVAENFLDDKQYEYDKQLLKTENITEVKEVVNNILKLYQNEDNLKLISLN